MAQFNVDSEVIAAKERTGTILRRIHHRRRQRYDLIPHDLQSSWTGSASANFQGSGPVARNPAPSRSVHHPDQRGTYPRRYELRRHRAG